MVDGSRRSHKTHNVPRRTFAEMIQNAVTSKDLLIPSIVVNDTFLVSLLCNHPYLAKLLRAYS